MANTQAVHNLEDAVRAQAAFVSSYTQRIAKSGYTDDDIDYLPGSLALLAALQSDHYNGVSLSAGTVMRDTGRPVSAEAASESRAVIKEYGAYAGDYGPESVFEFLGV